MEGFITDPGSIEKKSMEIIDEILREKGLSLKEYSWGEIKVLKRVIHTTADFEYAQTLEFLHDPLQAMFQALSDGCHLVTDTRMALSGINNRVIKRYGSEKKCFMDEEKVAAEAKERGITRAMVSMEYAARDKRNGIFVIGNAPTALVHLLNLIKAGRVLPRVVVGVPVGFVGAAESKGLLAQAPVPSIITRGRKGGSNVAAAIVNAVMYLKEELDQKEETER